MLTPAQPSPPKRRAVLDLHAAVLDDLEPGGLGLAPRLLVRHAELHPQHLRADGDGFVGERGDLLAPAEAVDDVDLVRDLRQRLVALLAQYRRRTSDSPGSTR